MLHYVNSTQVTAFGSEKCKSTYQLHHVCYFPTHKQEGEIFMAISTKKQKMYSSKPSGQG